jgi:hypothetical protein
MEKRHFYTACARAGETLSWADEWYTESWQVVFALKVSLDKYYVLIAVLLVITTRFTASKSIYDQQASTGPVDPPASIRATEPACLAIQKSLSSSMALTTSIARVPVTTAGSLTATITTGIPVAITAASMSFPTPTASLPTAFQAAGVPKAAASCAGEWDWQTAGVVGSLFLGILFGVLVWAIWAMLKGRTGLMVLYQPRRWFLPLE